MKLRNFPAVIVATIAVLMFADSCLAGCGHHGKARMHARRATLRRACASPSVTTGPGGLQYHQPVYRVPNAAQPVSYAAPTTYATPSFQGSTCPGGRCSR